MLTLSPRVQLGWAAAGAVVGVAAVTLALMGQPWWCGCGSPAPWAWDVWSRHNSQHLIDPYSFTHVLHGLVFYAVARGIVGDRRLDLRFAGALAVEAVWEIVENTDVVIQRYRDATISLEYFGDSVANSVADLGACAFGFALARRLPAWGSVLAFVLVELVLAAWIRDGLLLNVIMLIAPSDAIRAWQTGG